MLGIKRLKDIAHHLLLLRPGLKTAQRSAQRPFDIKQTGYRLDIKGSLIRKQIQARIFHSMLFSFQQVQEGFKLFGTRRMAHFTQSFRLYLTNTLTSNAKQLPDFF